MTNQEKTKAHEHPIPKKNRQTKIQHLFTKVHREGSGLPFFQFLRDAEIDQLQIASKQKKDIFLDKSDHLLRNSGGYLILSGIGSA